MNYNEANYDEVVRIADTLLKEDTFSIDDEIDIRTYLSFSLVAIGDTSRARKEFIKILLKKPDYSLNPEFVSPKIISIFLIAKDEYLRIVKEMKEKIPPPLWYGIILPGTYQFKVESRLKGNIMKYSFISSSSGLILSFLSKEILHRIYLSKRDQEEIDKWYRYYNLSYKSTFFFSYTTGGIYIFNLLDCLSLRRYKKSVDY
uniref:Tetratricopeptide repeat protein n=1 Tax=candidate division WOR-3 bacterium TaxID=2052148 RepID=A0A7C4UC41_UNCW3